MLTDVIRQFLKAQPFAPFVMSLTDRTKVRIARADVATVSASGDVVRVADADGRHSIISIRHVVSISPDPPPDDPVVVK